MNLLGDKELKAWQQLVAMERDPEAYRQLFHYFYPKAIQFGMSYLNSRQLAEEAVSDVMMNLWLLNDRLARIKNLKTYFFTAVRNKALDYLEKDKKRRFQLELHPNMVSDLASPEESMISNEAVGAILDVIDSLPPKCKTAFLLVRESHCSYREVAEIMGISENTVNRHIQQAIKFLNRSLKY